MKTALLLPVGLLVISAQSCLLPEERTADVFHRVVRRQDNTGAPIGTGDRFSSGSLAPRGLGSQSPSTSFNSILSVKEIDSGLEGLKKAYGITVFTTPYKTYNGASIKGGLVGGQNGTCESQYRVYINGNIHARERGSADNILYFISDLLYASKNGLGLTYGSKTYTSAQVKTALSAGIVFIPNSNPDGMAWDQSTNTCWRKNRSLIRGSNSTFGIDLNRNFDFLWDFKKDFASSVADMVASADPDDVTYHGTAPFSEPETQSIKWVLDTYSKVRWFVDLHSFAGDVLHSWGSDANQDQYPYMNFLNSTYDSVRGDLKDKPGSGEGYGEYIPASEMSAQVAAAKRIQAGLTAGGGRPYVVQQASALYPTSGASDDYAYSRHFANSSLNLVNAFTLEFGFMGKGECPFYPTVPSFNENIRATGAGFMELLLAAVELGLGDATSC